MMLTVESLWLVRVKIEADFPEPIGGPVREARIVKVFVVNYEPSEAVTLALETIGPTEVFRRASMDCEGTVVSKTLYGLMPAEEIPAGATLIVPNSIAVAAASIPIPPV